MNYKTYDLIRKILFELAGQPPYLFGETDNGRTAQHMARIFEKRAWNVTFLGWWICPGCFRKSKTVAWRRRNSAYIDDRNNWTFMCQECHDEDTANLQADWDDYYASRW